MKQHPSRTYGGVGAAERVAQRRAQLVEAACELYGTRGYAATGVKDICRRAGVTDRYFYESFTNQSELFAAAFDHATGQLLAEVALATAQAPAEPSQQVRAAIETFVRALAGDSRKARLLFTEPASVGGDVERHVRASIRRFADLVATSARPHVPAVADHLLTMGALSLVGAIQLVIIEFLDGNLPSTTVDDMIEYFVEMFLVAAAAGAAANGSLASSNDRP